MMFQYSWMGESTNCKLATKSGHHKKVGPCLGKILSSEVEHGPRYRNGMERVEIGGENDENVKNPQEFITIIPFPFTLW